MAITSFYFLCFYVLILLLYYVVPGKVQWSVLLLASLAYYLLSGNGLLILYPLATSVICFVSGKYIAAAEHAGRRRAGLVFALLGTLGILVILKYVNFGIYTYNGISSVFSGLQLDVVEFLIPLGISFYTLSILGYVIDIYYGIGDVSRNYFQFLLYCIYFPTLISGPIMRYGQTGAALRGVHKLDYEQVTKGMQRILWGFFKKLVIAERMAMIVNTVYSDYTSYQGSYLWIASFCFVIQLYTDFSGCMDIVLGISQTFGVQLPENFKTPFFSKSIAEYWRRWHITLGIWMKDYVFYPLLRSAVFTKLGKFLKKKWGKKRGKQLTTFCAMFILWFSVGIWHGGEWKYVLGSGLIHWSYIVIGELTEPIFTRFWNKCGMDPQNKFFNAVRMVRTFLLVTFGLIFFRAESVAAAVQILKSMFTVWNPMVLFSGTLFTFGLDWVEFVVAAVSLMIFITISVLQEQKGSVRDLIAAKKLPVRWILWYALLFYTILLGYYGPGYSAAEFIYQGF